MQIGLQDMSCKSQSYFRTDDQSLGLSWCQAPIWGHNQIVITARKMRFCSCWTPFWREDGSVVYNGCRFPVSVDILGFECSRAYYNILLPQIETRSNLEVQFPLFVSPTEQGAQFYSQALVPFSSPLTANRATAQVFNPLPHGSATDSVWFLLYRFIVLNVTCCPTTAVVFPFS
jgi:hypothetical protein